MAYVQKPGAGALWFNDRKTEEKHPDRTGTLVMPDGSEYFIDGWLKETKPGADGKTKKFLSLSVKLKTKRAPQDEQQQRQSDHTQSRPNPAKPLPPGRKPQHDPDLDPIDPASGEYKF